MYRRSRSFNRKLSFASVLLAATLSAEVTAIQPEAEDNEKLIRPSESYQGSKSMPDPIAFYIFVNMLQPQTAVGTNNADETVEISSEEVDTRLTEFIMSSTLLNDENARNFMLNMRAVAQSITQENDQSIRDVVCSVDAREWTPAQAINAYNLLDDIRQAVYAKHFALIRVLLSEEEVVALDSILAATKLSSSYFRLNYDEVFRDNPDQASSSLITYCSV